MGKTFTAWGPDGKSVVTLEVGSVHPNRLCAQNPNVREGVRAYDRAHPGARTKAMRAANVKHRQQAEA